MIYIIVSFIYLLILIGAISNILFEIKNPSRSLSWILVIIFVPVLGVSLYYLLGSRIKKDRMFQQQKPFYNTEQNIILPDRLPQKFRLMTLLSKNKSSALSYGNKVELLLDGIEVFEIILNAMEKASCTIHLDFYIVEQGEILDRCIEIFQRKSKEGIKVRMIYDGFGSYDLADRHKQALLKAGVELKEFMPFNQLEFMRFSNYRNHRKIVVIDNKIAFTGGFNITDKYHKEISTLGLWKDTFVKVIGPAAADLNKVFYCDWFYAGGSVSANDELEDINNKIGESTVQIIASGPDSEFKGIMQEYFTLITDAEDYIYMVTPYFVPSEAIITALKTSALSGIDVRLMLPYNPDYKWLRYCMFSFFEELLSAEVRIYLHHSGFLHAKTIVSDNIISSVGTANIDERSFMTNFEVNTIIHDERIAKELKQNFLLDIHDCEELSISTFHNRVDRSLVKESIARLTSPLL